MSSSRKRNARKPLSALVGAPFVVPSLTFTLAAFAHAEDAPIAAAAPQKVDKIEITTQKLDEARNGLSPDTGSSVYRFDKKDILSLPLGDSTPLNQVILRAPGAVQDSYGQLHVRGDHANLQYRINGVVIPEGISGFGQALDAHFADQLNVLTGALPAQYGYRTAGVIDIQTKGASFEKGGEITLQAGSRGHREGSLEIAGARDAFTYYLTGAYLRNDIGIENPTSANTAIHDRTRQGKGFGYLSYVLNDDSRVSLLFGRADNKFQIPNVPGESPAFFLDGVPPPLSERLDARQNEKNAFQVITYQGTGGKADYQFSLFHRYSDLAYLPDPIGDLAYNGVAAQILRRNEASGVQADLGYRWDAAHTLRMGVFAQRERFGVDNTSRVFLIDEQGEQSSGTPITIVDDSRLAGHTWGVYLQDQWNPTAALTINVGARYDRVDTIIAESQLSPRLGLTWDLGAKTRVHAGYARYFTPPPSEKIDVTSIARFVGTTNALPSDANTSVRAERSDYYDIGFSHQPTAQLTLGVDAYYRDVRHLQDEGQFGNALIFSAFNFEKARVRGVEFSAAYREKRFSAYANLSWSKAEASKIESGQFNFDEDELDYIGRHWVRVDHDQTLAGSAGLSWRMNETQFSADALYGSGLRRGFANTDHLPGYTQVNAAVTQGFRLGGAIKYEARLAVLNLFDRVYLLRDGSGIGVGAPQYAPRRTLYAGITARF